MTLLLSSYTVIELTNRVGAEAPPFVALTRDKADAAKKAIAWAEKTFGEGDYRVLGGVVVTPNARMTFSGPAI